MTVTLSPSLKDFNERLDAAGSMAVLVFFTAAWCGPCKFMTPIVEKHSEEYADKIVFLQIDADKDGDDVQVKYGVRGLPTIFFFRSGEPIVQLTGANPQKLAELCEEYGTE